MPRDLEGRPIINNRPDPAWEVVKEQWQAEDDEKERQLGITEALANAVPYVPRDLSEVSDEEFIAQAIAAETTPPKSLLGGKDAT